MMRWTNKLLLRLRSTFHRGRVDRELDEELHFHLERQIEENLAAGMSADEARYAARRAIGGIAQLKEECRDMRRVNLVQDFAQDLRYASRVLRKNPGFAAAAILSLALGIGINTAVFSLINAVLLRTLPVKNPEQLVVLTFGSEHRSDFSYPMYQDLRSGTSVLSGMLCRFTIPGSMNVSGHTERISLELVSGDYFQVLGISALIGRTLMPDDTRAPGGQPVVVLSNAFWKRRFGSDPGIVGKTMRLDGYPMTVVGITPAGFEGPEVGMSPDARVPITMYRAMLPTLPADLSMESRGWGWLDLVGRLKPGVSTAQAQAALNAVYIRARETEWKDWPAAERAQMLARGLWLEPGSRGISGLREGFSRPLWILMAAVSIVLLIACANVAGLLLARVMARQREIAVRLALGAGRGRVVRQLVTESILLSGTAAIAGLVMARWGSNLLVSFLPEGRFPVALNVEADSRVLAFTALVSLVTTFLFGLAPAFEITRPAAALALRAQAGSSGMQNSLAFRRGFMVLEVALSLVLLVGAGLFVRTLHNLKAFDIGYDRENILLLSLDPSLNGYTDDDAARFYEQVIQRVGSLPGVRSASVASMGLLGEGLTIQSVSVEGYQRREGARTGAWENFVSPGYFETLGIPVLSGRGFTPLDTKTAPKVAIVNQQFARRFFGNKNPIGRRFGFGTNRAEIVGVVRDGKYKSVQEETPELVYLPIEQRSDSPIVLHVRTVGDPGKLTAAIRREITDVDKNVLVYGVRTLEAQLDESLSQQRLVATLSSGFGFLAVLLAAIGLYGVMSYAVTRRTNEIGIRMALGAEGGEVIWMVLREALLLVGIGVAIGVPVALALAGSIASLLFGLKPTDPWTISAAAAVLFAVAAVASYLPARRAARVDPMEALRNE